ncbi:MAG TPA: response regulator [Steroidobacteraceae bacterium]|nr:response regulator [Steroidobacteraceae bacterium]
MSNAETKLRVLLVEDAALVVDQIRELLATVPRIEELFVVSTERDALRAIAQFEPHLAILDLKLKEGTGFGVLRSLGEMKSKPTTIVFTNYALPHYRDLSVLVGADYFLDKSRDFESLPGIIESLDLANRPPRGPLLH